MRNESINLSISDYDSLLKNGTFSELVFDNDERSIIFKQGINTVYKMNFYNNGIYSLYKSIYDKFYLDNLFEGVYGNKFISNISIFKKNLEDDIISNNIVKISIFYNSILSDTFLNKNTLDLKGDLFKDTVTCLGVDYLPINNGEPEMISDRFVKYYCVYLQLSNGRSILFHSSKNIYYHRYSTKNHFFNSKKNNSRRI